MLGETGSGFIVVQARSHWIVMRRRRMMVRQACAGELENNCKRAGMTLLQLQLSQHFPSVASGAGLLPYPIFLAPQITHVYLCVALLIGFSPIMEVGSLTVRWCPLSPEPGRCLLATVTF